jgi:hypothetical protein
MKEMEKLEIPIDSIRCVIEEKNWDFKLIWPKIKELKDLIE